MNILQKLFCSNVKLDKALYVQVVHQEDSTPYGTGFITAFSLLNKSITLQLVSIDESRNEEIEFNDIISISRMKDGRLRLWMKGGKR